jgi:hypothetical protein
MDMLLFKEEGFVVHGKERISSQTRECLHVAAVV